MDDEQLKITTVDFDTRGQIPGMSGDEFENTARQVEQICPLSNALRNNAEIQLNTSLERRKPTDEIWLLTAGFAKRSTLPQTL